MSDKTYISSVEHLVGIEDTRNRTLRSTRKVLGDFHRENLKGKESVLEIGSGIGFLRRAWPNFDGEWVELELISEHLKESKNRNPYATFIRGEGNNLPFADETFDVVCGFNSFDQYPSLDNVVNESYRVLKPGGLFFHMMDQGQATPAIEEDLVMQGFEFLGLRKRVGDEEVIQGIREDAPAELVLARTVTLSLSYGTPEEVREYQQEYNRLFQELTTNGKVTPATASELHERLKGKLTEVNINEALTELLIKSLNKYFLSESVERGSLTAVYRGGMTDRQISISERRQKFIFEGYLPSPNLQDEHISETDMFLFGIVNNILGRLPPIFTRYIKPRVLELSGINYVKAIKG